MNIKKIKEKAKVIGLELVGIIEPNPSICQ